MWVTRLFKIKTLIAFFVFLLIFQLVSRLPLMPWLGSQENQRSQNESLGLERATAAVAAVEKKPMVVVQEAKWSELAEVLTYPARIEPKIRASVLAEAEGVVSKILAPLGKEVRAGQAILKIRNTDPVFQYAPMVVSSPVSGVVSRVEVTEGSRVSRGDKLVLVTDPDQLRVLVEITAQDLRLIRPGLKADLNPPGDRRDQEVVKLRVRGVSPFVDPATGTATCELERAPYAVDAVAQKGGLPPLPPPGTIARVEFRVNIRQGFSVPDSAITYRGKDPYVRVVKEGRANLVRVEIGKKSGDQVEILKGLQAGDQFIERSSGYISEGEEVEIQESSSESSPAAQQVSG